MGKNKTHAGSREKPRPSPDVQRRPDNPEKREGPLPAGRDGTAGRAQDMVEKQQTVGNARAGRATDQSGQTKPPSSTAGGQVVQRQPNPPKKESTLGDVLQSDKTIRIGGMPAAQPNYADRSFQGISSAPLGEEYIFYPQFDKGVGTKGISISKREFHLDADPLSGFTIVINSVYQSRDVALAVLAELKQRTPDANFVVYYLRDGYIFPTTFSEKTLPILIPNLRRVRENDLAGIKATGDLAEDVLWWYVGARFPIRIGRGKPPGAPAVREAERQVASTGAAAGVAFDASRVAGELLAATKSVAHSGQRMLVAARQLAAMRNLSAVQKSQVMLEFFRGIGFAISKAGVVDEAAQLVMHSEDSRYAFRFIKATGEILYGKFDVKTLQYIWQAL
jgi:hypothetical protein